MRGVGSWPRLLAIGAMVAAAGCSNPFGRQYEYEEQLYLSVDGSASVTVNTSLHALQVLRGVSVGSVNARPDRDAARRILAEAGCPVTYVGRPWTRDGRHYLQVRLETADVRALSKCVLFSWSRYALSLSPGDGTLHYEQHVGSPARGLPEAGGIWTGREIVAFRLHLPSRVRYQNIRRLEDDTAGSISRGNIGAWEQLLSDRLKGKPVVLIVDMDAASILNRTLWLFAGALVAALATLAAVVWWLRRKRLPASAR